MGIVKSILKSVGLYEVLVAKKRNMDQVSHNRQEQKHRVNRIAFYRTFLKEGQLVFDVGANMGNRVEIFLELGCKVVAVEPQPKCQSHLLKTFGNRINIVAEGLGEKVEKKTMYISNVSTISSLSEEWIDSVKKTRFAGQEWNQTETISINTMDNLISTYGLPFFCKIDVEGYELEVLKGLSQPVPFMSLEYTVPEQTNKLEDCIKLLHRLDPDYVYNYSNGEDMSFAMPQFVSYDVFINYIYDEKFQASGFGDIYVKSSEF
ncbi:MAG: FkbM family methyltransferase [Chitinophagaceae bacterium]|nr:MAG: FkbM family methyltransferase [Chitinophagaceae bacterium]